MQHEAVTVERFYREHAASLELKLVDRAYLIHKGEVVYEGVAEQLVNDPKAREIYLGPEFNL